MVKVTFQWESIPINPLDSMSTFISGHMWSFSAEAGLQRRHKYVLKLLKPGSYLFGWI